MNAEHQNWLESLAAEPDADDWVIRAAYPEGRIEFDFEPWHGLYWEAWEALRFDRQYGAFGGESPISYVAMRAYAAANGVHGADFDLFRRFLGMVDDEWLRHVSERSKARNQK